MWPSVARLGHGWAFPGAGLLAGIYDSVAANLAAHIDEECCFANFYWQTGFFFYKHVELIKFDFFF